MKTNILVVFANPSGTNQLRLDAEDKAIKDSFLRGRHRDYYNLRTLHAVTIQDLRQAILGESYSIVQISGHGTNNGLVLENDEGGIFVVPQKALAELFQIYSPPLQCVVLNACYSIAQGKLISLGVPYTIATEGAIADKAAIEFSRGFYDGITANRDIPFAYDEGGRAVALAGLSQGWVATMLRSTEVFESTYWKDHAISTTKANRPVQLTEAKALVGIAVDVSGSMQTSINNNTRKQTSRLESFRQTIEQWIKDTRKTIIGGHQDQAKPEIDVFIYGFGLRLGDGVCDLLSLMRTDISKEEIERLKKHYIKELEARYSSGSSLLDLARRFGLGQTVEHIAHGYAEQEIRDKIAGHILQRCQAIGDTTLSLGGLATMWQESEETMGNAQDIILGSTPMRGVMHKVLERFCREIPARSKDTFPVLFLLSDGEPTDGNPLPY